MIIGEYSPRRSRDEYSPIITEPEANNCFSINTQVIISKKRKKKPFNAKSPSTYSGKTTTGSHFVRRGDYRLIIRDSEPMRARDFVLLYIGVTSSILIGYKHAANSCLLCFSYVIPTNSRFYICRIDIIKQLLNSVFAC